MGLLPPGKPLGLTHGSPDFPDLLLLMFSRFDLRLGRTYNLSRHVSHDQRFQSGETVRSNHD